MLTYLHIAQPAFPQSRHFFTTLYTNLELSYLIWILKKEPVSQEEGSECEIIEVVDLTKQVQRDAGQTIVELKAHVSLKFTISWLQLHVCLSVKFKILLVNLVCKISKVKYLFSLKTDMYISVCLSVCDIQRHFVICSIWQLRPTHWGETEDKLPEMSWPGKRTSQK